VTHHAGWLMDVGVSAVIRQTVYHVMRGLPVLVVLLLCAIAIATYLRWRRLL
jgi:hypothetical protein